MLATLRSAFLLGLLEAILMKGLEFAETYTQEKEDEVEVLIKSLIPGENFDEMGWGFVKPFIPQAFELAKHLIDKIDGVDSEQALALKFQAVHSMLKA